MFDKILLKTNTIVPSLGVFALLKQSYIIYQTVYSLDLPVAQWVWDEGQRNGIIFAHHVSKTHDVFVFPLREQIYLLLNVVAVENDLHLIVAQDMCYFRFV